MADVLPPDRWFSLEMLDRVELTADIDRERAQVEAALPVFQQRVAEAQLEVSESLMPAPASHPAHESWDDGVWFQRSLRETGLNAKSQWLAEIQVRLEELERSNYPGQSVAGWVLDSAHGYIKERGLSTHPLRSASLPLSLGDIPLAEVIWQARNQHHHFNDGPTFHLRTLEALQAIATTNPEALGLSTPPTDEQGFLAQISSKSFAREILVSLGWTSAEAVKASLLTIAPNTAANV